MIRPLIAAAALLALAGCGVVGPTEPELARAVDAFYVRAEHPEAPRLQDAPIRVFEGCQPLSGTFRCGAIFSTSEGDVATLIWIVRAPHGGWEVRNIVRNERTN